jgi:hypothetical protein
MTQSALIMATLIWFAPTAMTLAVLPSPEHVIKSRASASRREPRKDRPSQRPPGANSLPALQASAVRA